MPDQAYEVPAKFVSPLLNTRNRVVDADGYLRLHIVDVAGQEILTRNKVSVHVNLTAGHRVADVMTAFSKQAKPLDFLFKEWQFELRAAGFGLEVNSTAC